VTDDWIEEGAFIIIDSLYIYRDVEGKRAGRKGREREGERQTDKGGC
jgi:hypothetical protein